MHTKKEEFPTKLRGGQLRNYSRKQSDVRGADMDKDR